MRRTQPGTGKAARADRDEDTGPLVVARQFLRHEAVEEGGADHEADEEARALDGDGGERDGNRVDGGGAPRRVGGRDEVGAEGGRQEERVGWEDPDGGHGVDGENSVLRCECGTAYRRRWEGW